MKNITPNQRTLNILKNAIELGFEFDESNTVEEIRIKAEEFLIKNAEAIEEECEVLSLGTHGQKVDWSDGVGFEYWSQGQIVDFKAHWFDKADTKVFHSTVVNSFGRVVKLYYLVGETEFNKEY